MRRKKQYSQNKQKIDLGGAQTFKAENFRRAKASVRLPVNAVQRCYPSAGTMQNQHPSLSLLAKPLDCPPVNDAAFSFSLNKSYRIIVYFDIPGPGKPLSLNKSFIITRRPD